MLAAPLASAQCSVKSGQIDIITPLTAAWKLYNSQVAINAEIDEKIANVTVKSNAKDASIAAHHAGIATSAGSAHDASVGEVAIGHGQKVADLTLANDGQNAAIDQAHADAQAAIETQYQAKLAALNDNIAEFNNRGDNFQDWIDESIGVMAAFDAEATHNNTVHADSLAAFYNNRQAEAVVHYNEKDAVVRGKFAASQLAAEDRNAAKYSAVIAKLEAKKFDVDATLAVLDNAGAEGGSPYAADCFVPAQTAIDYVKSGLNPGAIWDIVVNGAAAP